MNFKPADVIMSMDKKSLFSRAVLSVLRFFQKDDVDYQHTMMAIDEEICIEANWKVELNFFRDRVGQFKRYKVIRHNNLTDEQRELIVERAKELLGERYSVVRILLQLLDNMFHTNYFTRRIKDPEQQICSSLVAWSYDVETGIKFNGVHWSSCEPDDIDDESLKPGSDFKTIVKWERP